MKKLLKTTIAVSALAAVSMQADAAVTNYSSVVTGWQNLYGSLLPPSPTTPGGVHFLGAGTASYDDATSILSYGYTVTFDMVHVFPLGPSTSDPLNPIYPAVATWNAAGTMDLAAGTGTNVTTGCTGYAAFCASASNADGVPIAWQFVTPDSVANPTLIDYGFWDAMFGPGYKGTDLDMALTASAPVPVPAAAWLFGSGLLGLAGIGRRRGSSTKA